MSLSRQYHASEASSSGSATSFTTSSISIADGRLMIVGIGFMHVGGSGAPPSNVTLSDSASHTWTVIRGQEWTGFWGHCQKWHRAVRSGSGTLTFTATIGGSMSGRIAIHVLSYSGYDPSSPIGLVAGESFDTPNDGAYTLSLGGTSDGTSEVLGIINADTQDGVTIAPGSGWTELWDRWDGSDLKSQCQANSGALSSVAWADLNESSSTFYNATSVAFEVKADPSLLRRGRVLLTNVGRALVLHDGRGIRQTLRTRLLGTGSGRLLCPA
ncbi:MAG: hypothetical protein NZ534_00050 [Bacteroidia bacterium]|nr:hypothetical protein [Bacteroidia bacterium]